MGSKELEKYLESRKEDWQELLKLKSNPEKFNEHLGDLESSILSVDINKTYDILLSWGGPSDGFKVDTDQDNELTNIRYWHADWGTYEERRLDDMEKEDFLSTYGGVLQSYEIKY